MLPKEDREIISKIGRNRYSEMKKMNLSYEDYLKYQKIKQKEKELNKEKRHEKDKIRQRTVRYIERYCNLKMKCQICDTENDVQIHHPNYNDYLKINLLCRQHHVDLHNFELIPPPIINLEKIAFKKPRVLKGHVEHIEEEIENIKQNILNNGATIYDMTKKYHTSIVTIKKFLSKEEGEELSRKSKENYKKRKK